jgi:gliding motility-associated-like protein
MTITVNPTITPTFAAMGPYCPGASFGPLPTTSTNGITGTWSPAINNSATTTYTFTPSAGQCANTTTMTITINSNITPTFAALGSYCSGASFGPLPTTSNNGITGTWSPAINNTATTTYTFTPSVGLCATTTTMTIIVNPNTTPTFAAMGPYCSGTSIGPLPTTSINGITGTWSPAINNTSTTTYTFTPTSGLCANSVTLTITIDPNITPTFTALGPYCSGASFGPLPTTSLNGITGTWSPAINNTATTTYTFTPTVGLCATNTTMTIVVDPNITPNFTALGPYCSSASFGPLPTTSLNGITGTWSPAINNTATTTYTFTPTVGLCATNATMTVVVDPNITPTFAALGPYCSGASIGPLPTTSINGITGTWSPAINNTATTTYTFTPTAGLCATTATMTIVVDPNITPTFTTIGPFCSGASFGPLPNTSTNGITGTWSPAINNTATTTYTFTPTAGLCATTTTMTIVVDPNITPTFTALGPYCSGASLGPLPTTSINGITGTWSPAFNNTATTTYTFTPTAGLCATNTTMTIVISTNITPTFTALGPYCSGASFGPLPATSLNGITGTWSPAINNTATTTYTFTPTTGQCAITATMTIVVDPNITPTFTALGPYCSGASIGSLSTTSDNGITGTWSPAIDNTTTTTYTFTPTAGLCATNATMTIVVDPNITPTFTALGPFCSGVSFGPLPNTSTNGITGTWSPAINNTATTTYTFTPTAGLCATTATMTIVVDPNITPTFTALGPFCSGASFGPLPTTSTNGITGTWSPAINNTATTTYTFTPTAGLCATITTMTIVVSTNITPTFTALGPYCSGASFGPLPTTSLNGITGTWSPAINNTATTTYTFTPTTGQCATNQTLNIVVNSNPTVNAGADTAIGSCSYSNYVMNPTPTGTIVTWNWTGAGINPTNTQNPIAHPTTATNYIVTVTDNNGCTASDNIFINVRPLPTATTGADVSIGSCPLSDTTLYGVGTGAGPLSYTWSPSTGITPIPPSGQNVLAKPNATTTYILTVTDRFGCTAIDNIIVTVNPLPTAEAGINDTIGSCASSSITLHGTGTGTGTLGYSWSPTAGLTTPNSQNTIAKPTTTTTYQLTVRDVYGCTAADNVTVNVNVFSVDAGPNADRGSCNTSTAILNGNPNGIGPYSGISWTPTNGLSTTINYSPVTATPSSTTTYTLTMTDAFGCTASDYVIVTVHPLPNVDAGYNDSIGSCVSSTATLNGNATGSSPFVYLWSPPGGLSNTNISNPIAKPNTTAVYTLTVTDNYSCTASDNVTIIVKPLPTTTAGADTTIGYCNTSVALLSGAGSGTATLNYSWTPTTGITSVNSPVTNAKPSITTTYILTITDRFGCTATDNVTVNISTVAADAGNDIALGTCAGSSGQMNASATGTGPFTFNWSPPTGLSQTNIPNPNAQPGITTNYSVVVTDFFGCSATDAMVASVNIFDETVLHFTMIPDQGCQPLTTTFGFTPNAEIVPDSWLWDFGDNSSTNHTSTELNPVYTFVNIGNYIVTLTVTSIYGCTVSYSDTVRVSRKPIAAFVNHPEVGSSDNPRIDFSDQSSYANHWLWNFGDPGSGIDNISTTTNAVHIFSDTGLFKVILIVSNAEGCSDTAERYITIYQDFTFFIPNAITPNEDKDNEVFLPQGVGYRTQGYLMLIFDRWGKQLFKNENVYKGWDAISPNGKPYPQGVYTYLITVFEESGKKHIFKGVITVVSPDHN